MESRAQQVAALLAVQVLFGMFPVAAKEVFPFLGPFAILAVRVAGAAAALLLLHRLLVRNPIPIRTQWPRVGGLAMLGVVLNMGMFMVGLQYTTAVEAVLVITTIPVFTYTIAVLMGREAVGPYRILGIACAMMGVLFLTLSGWEAGGGLHLLGDLLILGNALSYAAFLVLARGTIHRYDPLSLTTWVFAIGAVVFLPFGLMDGLAQDLPRLPAGAAAWMVFIILGPSVLTYVLNTLALRHVAASTVAGFTYIQPVFTAVFAYLVLGETPSWALLPSAALVFLGVWLVARREPKVLEGQVVVD